MRRHRCRKDSEESSCRHLLLLWVPLMRPGLRRDINIGSPILRSFNLRDHKFFFHRYYDIQKHIYNLSELGRSSNTCVRAYYWPVILEELISVRSRFKSSRSLSMFSQSPLLIRIRGHHCPATGLTLLVVIALQVEFECCSDC